MLAFHVLRKYWNLIPFLKKKMEGGVEFMMNCNFITEAVIRLLTAPPFLSHLFCLAKREGNYQYHPFLKINNSPLA